MPIPSGPTGIAKLDRLLSDPAEPPLVEGTVSDEDKPAVGVVQDLINRFDPQLEELRPLLPEPRKKWKPLPLPSVNEYGLFGPKTRAFVTAFQKHQGLPETGQVNQTTLLALAQMPLAKALITPGHFIVEFGERYSHFLKAVVLTGGKECRFDFTVMNRNTDAAGLSLGILHWAQKPKRLYEIIKHLRDTSPTWHGIPVVNLIFGGSVEMQSVLDHLNKPNGGVVPGTGVSTDPAYEFANPPMAVAKYWPACFAMLVGAPFAQRTMTDYAVRTFRKLYDDSYTGYPGDPSNLVGRNLRVYAPKLVSQRAVIFALDMINQHGGHVPQYYGQIVAANPQATEAEVLNGLRDRASAFWLGQTSKPLATRQKNAAADAARRNYFLNTPHLSSQVPFDPS